MKYSRPTRFRARCAYARRRRGVKPLRRKLAGSERAATSGISMDTRRTSQRMCRQKRRNSKRTINSMLKPWRTFGVHHAEDDRSLPFCAGCRPEVGLKASLVQTTAMLSPLGLNSKRVRLKDNGVLQRGSRQSTKAHGRRKQSAAPNELRTCRTFADVTSNFPTLTRHDKDVEPGGGTVCSPGSWATSGRFVRRHAPPWRLSRTPAQCNFVE
jgi:hypothetical protein